MIKDRYVDIGRRVLCSLIDLLIILVLFTLILFVSTILYIFNIKELSNMMTISIIIIIIATKASQPFANVFLEKTIGMRVLKYSINNYDGTKVSFIKRFLRFIIYLIVSFIPVSLVLNIVLIIITEKRQSLPDIICKTVCLDN